MPKPMDDSYGLLIDGEWGPATGGKTFDVYCPANGEKLATCADASREDVDRAVKAAYKALPAWKNVHPAERAGMLLKIADLIDADTPRIAMVETMDVGRILPESGFFVFSASDHFRYFAGALRTEEGEAMMLDKDSLRIVLTEPLGVVGQIIPWNVPITMGALKLAPALAAGNTVVIKPSSTAPLGVMELAKVLAQVLPPGVVNVITGGGSTTGNYMLEHPGFRKLAFTGSTDVGYSIAAAAANKLIPATLELGGKSANIVFPDCDWQKAVGGVQMGILVNSGQVCCAGSRVFVHEDIYDRFLADCVASFNSVKVGLPWEDGVGMGSIVDKTQMEKVLSYVEIGKAEGAKVACGGYRITDGELGKGYFVKPTILSDVDNKMRVAQEEIFGPMAVFIKFKDEADAVRMANDSDYGLAGGVWTKDINKAIRVARNVETGTMWVNTFLAIQAGAPFGGYKKSGYGREAHKMVLEHYSQKKNIFLGLSES